VRTTINSKRLAFAAFFLFGFFIQLNAYANSASASAGQPALRLLVSGNLYGNNDASANFFQSPLLRLDHLSIQDSSLNIYYYNGAYFISALDYPFNISKNEIAVWLLDSAFAFSVKENQLQAAQTTSWAKNVGAKIQNVKIERGNIENQAFIAFKLINHPNFKWPQKKSDFMRLPAIKAKHTAQAGDLYILARAKNQTSQILGFIQQRLKDNSISTQWIDLGNLLAGPYRETKENTQTLRKVIQELKPAVILADSYDSADLKALPYIIGVQGSNLPSAYASINFASTKANFLALADESVYIPSLLPKDAKIIHVSQIENLKGIDMAGLNIALAPTLSLANQVSSKGFYDLVIAKMESSDLLPQSDDMFLPHEDSAKTIPPLVRVSSGVTQVDIWAKNSDIARVKITRYSIDEKAPVHAELLAALQKSYQMPSIVLPTPQTMNKKLWTQTDFDTLFGQALLKSSQAELAIFEKNKSIAPISGAVHSDMARALMQRPGRMFILNIRGEDLKNIFKLIKNKQLGDFEIVGGNLRAGTIRQMPINAEENYLVVVSENVIAAFSETLEKAEVLGKGKLARAKHIEAYVGETGGLHVMTSANDLTPKEASTIQTQAQSQEQAFMDEVTDDFLSQQNSAEHLGYLLKSAKGDFKSRLVLDIREIDFGFSWNKTNGQAQIWKDRSKESLKTGGDRFKIPNGRLTLLDYLHVLIQTNTALRLETPVLDSSLFLKMKFFTWDFDGSSGPIKDKLQFGLEFKVPDERWAAAAERSWYVSPLVQTMFETNIWPIGFLISNADLQTTESWEKKGWMPRTKEFTVFAGILTGPMNRIFSLRIGPMGLFNFNKTTFEQTFDYGGEIESHVYWTLGPIGFQIDGNFRALFPITSTPDPDKLGFDGVLAARIILARIGDFSVAAVDDFAFGSNIADRATFGTSNIIGLALSYGKRAKWQL